MKKILILIVLALAANAHAGTAGSGILSDVHFMNNGVVIVYTSGVRADVPTCASTQPDRFAIDASTEAGKAQLSGLLAAYVAEKTVRIFGMGSCAAHPDTETINYFVIDN